MHPFPRLCGSRAFAWLSFLSLLMLACSLAPQAQGYPGGGYPGGGYPGGGYPGGGSPPAPSHYWQVTYVSQGDASMDYIHGNQYTPPLPSSAAWIDTVGETTCGGGMGGQYAVDAFSSGTITTTLTWVPAAGQTLQTDPPSEPVFLVETASASWSINSPSAPTDGAYISDGLGDPVLSNPNTSEGGQISSGAHLLQRDGSSGTITLAPVSMSAGTAPYHLPIQWAYAAAGCSFGVQVLNVRLTLIGTTKDSSGLDNILVGQNCTAILDIPDRPASFTLGPPTWSIPGDVFTAFVISSDQTMGEAFPYPDPRQTGTPVQPTFYWRDAGVISGYALKTIHATAPVYYTADSTVSYIGDVNAKKDVNVWVPDEYDTPPFVGTTQPNPQLSAVTIALDPDDASAGEVTCNYNLSAAVVTPALFTGNGFGEWAWLQECQIDVTQGGGRNPTQMASLELDSSFPYNTLAGPGGGIPGKPNDAQTSPKGNPLYSNFDDNPGQHWYNYILPDLTFAFNDHFNLYVMYQPPDTGYGVNWVPIDLYQWGYNASMTRPNGSPSAAWTPNPPGTMVNGGKTSFPSYPYWNNKFIP